MKTDDAIAESTEILQQLGLKEYEAKCFVGLSRLSTGTAKQLGEITDVPRTRVYDAIRILEAQGLVEIQHSSPQQFRAVSVSEAAETLGSQYGKRVDRMEEALENTSSIEPDTDNEIQEVWSMSGGEAIATRTDDLLDDAAEEVVLVIGDAELMTDELVATLNELATSIDLLIGAVTEPLQEAIHDAVPEATTFLSGLGWLRSEHDDDDDMTIGRFLLVDRSTILVSTVLPETRKEQAIFGDGFQNGLVVIARRLISYGLIPERDPESARAT